MFVKLVRKDCKFEEAISLGEGKHVIGRGNMLECDDKRISRNHMTVELHPNRKLVFTPLHTNPCFYYPSNNLEQVVILHQNQQKIISEGDEVSFLPDSFRYQVQLLDGDITHLPSNDRRASTSIDNFDEGNYDANTEQLENDQVNKDDSDVIPIVPQVQSIDLCMEQTADETATFEESSESPNLEEENSPTKRKGSKELEINEAGTAGQSSKRPRLESPEDKKPTVAELQRVTAGVEANCSGSGTHEVKSHELNIGNTVSCNIKKEEPGNGEEACNDQLPRDKCEYGRTCYRRNPQHRRNVSHPGDTDWDDPMPCPYGINCYRTNAQHRQLYTHPGPPAPKPPAGGKKKKQVQNKMKTRAVKAKKQRKENWSDSEEEAGDDPWLSAESSDDYAPSDLDQDELSDGSIESRNVRNPVRKNVGKPMRRNPRRKARRY